MIYLIYLIYLICLSEVVNFQPLLVELESKSDDYNTKIKSDNKKIQQKVRARKKDLTRKSGNKTPKISEKSVRSEDVKIRR